MKTKILITIIILTILLIGGFFMRNYLSGLFGMSNETVLLEWHSKTDVPNPWEGWRNGPKFEISPIEKELVEYYYQNKFNQEKQILDFKYTIYKVPIILNYKQIKAQSDEEYKKVRMKSIENRGYKNIKGLEWIYEVHDKRGLIIQILVSNKFKDKFLKEGWKLVLSKDNHSVSSKKAISIIKNLPEIKEWLNLFDELDSASKPSFGGKPIIKIDNIKDKIYTIHVFEEMLDHEATFNWYYVNIETEEVKKEFDMKDSLTPENNKENNKDSK